MMIKYGYLKRYTPPPRDLTPVWRFSSVTFFLVGLFLMGSAVTPILSYQLTFSPKVNEGEILTPLSFEEIEDSFSLSRQVLGEQTEPFWSTEVKNWFPEVPLPEIAPEVKSQKEITSYNLSIPKLRIFDAVVKVGVENLNKNLVHYPGTAYPGRPGNAVIFGHSVLPQFFNPRNYMTIFSTLPTLIKGEEILVDYDGVRYAYAVEEMKEVRPNDVSILAQKTDSSYVSLVTCVPPGTFLRRLVVRAKLTK